jgi:uncharacterized protein YbbC (DUF1343 family)
LLKDKVLAIVANQTSRIGIVHLVDSLKSSGFNIKCVFAPEHGFRGDQGAGEDIHNSIDELTGIPVISLYGRHMKPTQDDLKGVDLVIFDIQDVGVRFYTYISTLQYVMEACADFGKELIVLDRPNPHGFYIDGPVLEKKFSSFVGMQPVPIVYGMTIGEYAAMLNGEGWLQTKNKCNLRIIPIKNYEHKSKYRLPVPPSPNLPDMESIYVYPSICLFEGTNVSLGRGTDKPFRLIGYPTNPNGGVEFTPVGIPGVAPKPPFKDQVCKGIDVSADARRIDDLKKLELKYLLAMYAEYPDKNEFFTKFFENLAGTSELRKQIQANMSADEIRNSWKEPIEKFKVIRKKYLLYKDFE